MATDDNKEKIAVALKYNEKSEDAPRLVAKGQGHVAEQIIKLAKEHDLHIHEDADLVEILSVLELDSYIPIEAYLAVAEILAYVYKENARKAGREV